MVSTLASQGLVCSGRHDGLRISLHLHNTVDDVHAALNALPTNINLLVTGQARAGAGSTAHGRGVTKVIFLRFLF